MNAISISSIDLIDDNNNNMDSDSDTNPDDTPQYYQPISAADVDSDVSDDDAVSDEANSDEEHHNLNNGFCTPETQNGFCSLRLNHDAEQKDCSDGEEEEEEEEEEVEEDGTREASDSAIMRAFREDETRRNAPLTQENAMRVMEAMRGVTFGGAAPEWAGQISEDQWINQLRRLREP